MGVSPHLSTSFLGDLCSKITGKPVDDAALLRAKYILVVFIDDLPSLTMNDAFFHLHSIRDDVELLLVLKLWSHQSPDYFNSLSELPSPCLVATPSSEFQYNCIRNFFRSAASSEDDVSGFFLFLVDVSTDSVYCGDWCTALLSDLMRDCLTRSSWPIIPGVHSTQRAGCKNCAVTAKLKSFFPHYSEDIHQMMMMVPKIKIDRYFDVLSLLSCNGQLKYLHRLDGEAVKLDEKTFQGKYIMVCCVHAPITREHLNAKVLQALSSVCSELFLREDIDFEMVVIPTMNQLANDEVLFKHFLSGFPSACLTVPFKDSHCRDFICNYLRVHDPFDIQCLLLDPNRIALLHCFPVFILDYGADGFPFTPHSLQQIWSHDLSTWRSPSVSRLEGIMGCSPSDVLYRINPAGVREETTVSQLSNKVVGLYLCVEKYIDPHHIEVVKECHENQLPLEIVLVYFPFGDCAHPDVYQQHINTLLDELKVCWWRLPYKDSISRRLKRLSNCMFHNAIVIVGPHGEYFDDKGGEVMKYYRSDLYPFTREGLVQRELSKLRDLTLESLWSTSKYNYVLRGGDKIAVADLPPMNVLVYFGSLDNLVIYHRVCDHYYDLKAEIPDFEVVFIQRKDDHHVEGADDLISKMPWLVCPFDASLSDFMTERIFIQGVVHDVLFEFGKDGRACSLYDRCIPDNADIHGNPFEDHLLTDVILQLHYRAFHEFMDDV